MINVFNFRKVVSILSTGAVFVLGSFLIYKFLKSNPNTLNEWDTKKLELKRNN